MPQKFKQTLQEISSSRSSGPGLHASPPPLPICWLFWLPDLVLVWESKADFTGRLASRGAVVCFILGLGQAQAQRGSSSRPVGKAALRDCCPAFLEQAS